MVGGLFQPKANSRQLPARLRPASGMLLQPSCQRVLLMVAEIDAAIDLLERQLDLCRSTGGMIGEELLGILAALRIAELCRASGHVVNVAQRRLSLDLRPVRFHPRPRFTLIGG